MRGRKKKPAAPELAARILDVTPAEYHTDPLPTPSLSSSIAHAIVSQSPLHGFTEHPKLGGVTRAATEPMNNGTIMHRLLLGKGAALAVLDVADFRSKEAREAREAAVLAGKVPVKLADFQAMAEVAAKLRDRLAAAGFTLNGQSEVALGWYEMSPETGKPVLCRSMFDHVFLDRGAIYDVKLVSNANPRDCARTFFDRGQDIAYHAYTKALGKLVPELEGRIEMTFLYCEAEPPHCVVPAQPDGYGREIGAQRWAKAVTLWERGLATGEWPGYGDSVKGALTLETPPWILRDELGEESL